MPDLMPRASLFARESRDGEVICKAMEPVTPPRPPLWEGAAVEDGGSGEDDFDEESEATGSENNDELFDAIDGSPAGCDAGVGDPSAGLAALRRF